MLAMVVGVAPGCTNDEPRKVELVDSTKKNQNLEPNAVSEETIQALQAAIDELKSKNDSLQSQVSALQSQGSAHNNELAALGASVNAINQSAAPTRWLYDGNKVKRKKVISIFDRLAWQEAVVEIEPGVNAHYILGRLADIASTESPQNFIDTNGNSTAGILGFTSADCSDPAYMGDLQTGADIGQAGTVGQYVVWVTAAAQRNLTTLIT